MICFTCATMIVRAAAAQSAATPSSANRAEPRGVLSVSNDLLRDSENRDAIDVGWILRDDRRSMPTGLSVADHAPLPQNVLQRMSGKSLKPAATPHVESPLTGDDGSDVNDRLVPVPVIHTGWAILLCAVLFQFGARVLRMHRRAAA